MMGIELDLVLLIAAWRAITQPALGSSRNSNFNLVVFLLFWCSLSPGTITPVFHKQFSTNGSFINKKRLVFPCMFLFTLLSFQCLHYLLFVLALILLLCNDIHQNPGPHTHTMSYEELTKTLSEEHTNCTKIVHANFQSMAGKPELFREAMVDLHDKKTIIGITETWLRNDDSSNTWSYDKDHLQFFRKDRSHANPRKKGGGVALYVPTQYHPLNRTDLSLSTVSVDSIVVEADSPPGSNYKRQIIGLFYCPNKCFHSELIESINHLLQSSGEENKEVILLGDFNLNVLNDAENALLKNSLMPFDMECLNRTLPTRVTSTAQTLIDHIVVRKHSDYLSYVSDFPFSDHNLICAVSKYAASRPKMEDETFSYRDKKSYKKETLILALKRINWSNINTLNNVDSMVDFFETKVTEVLDVLCPMVEKKKIVNAQPPKPWMTEEIRNLATLKRQTWRLFIKEKTPQSEYLYKNTKRKLNALLRKEKSKYYNEHFKNLDDSRSRWRFMNNTLQRKNVTRQIEKLMSGNETLSQPKDIVNCLNKAFVSLGEYTGRRIPYTPSPTLTRHCFNFSFATNCQVLACLKKMKVRKAPGLSVIPTWALKDGADVLCTPICSIFNRCVTDKTFPAKYKNALVTPIFKKDDETLPSNYRPISLTTNVSKIIERLMSEQMMAFLVQNKLLSKTQFGFRPGFSTTDALLYTIESWRKTLDDNQKAVVAALDLSKAFDSIDHEILMNKLTKIGLTRDARSFLSNYLSNRHQAVRHNSTTSDWLPTVRGVPQGTILGPLLFLLYVNDIHEYINCLNSQYADDTLIFSMKPNLKDSVDDVTLDCNKLNNYFGMHRLSLNVLKTEFMILGKTSTNEGISLTIEQSSVKPVPEIKYLGITIDSQMNFNTQVNKILQKMAIGIKTIRHIRSRIPLTARIQLLHALVLSHVNYGCVLLTDISQTNRMKLERQLNWGLRVVYQKKRRFNVDGIRLSAHILTISQLIKYFCLTKFSAILFQKHKPFQSLSFPNLSANIETIMHRRNKALPSLRFKKHYMENSFVNTSIKDFNNFIAYLERNNALTRRDISSGFCVISKLRSLSISSLKKWIFNYLIVQQCDPLTLRNRELKRWHGTNIEPG